MALLSGVFELIFLYRNDTVVLYFCSTFLAEIYNPNSRTRTALDWGDGGAQF